MKDDKQITGEFDRCERDAGERRGSSEASRVEMRTLIFITKSQKVTAIVFSAMAMSMNWQGHDVGN